LKNMKNGLYLVVGTITLVVGIIGVFIPVLPTTPFLLLSSFCYLRSSSRMYHWLMGHKVLGPYISSYMIYKGITRKNKVVSLVFLWTTLTISMVFIGKDIVTWVLLVVGTLVSIHILMLRTLTQEEQEEIRRMVGENRR